jgi:MerR family mercuric resistance operon transcriptional regulator
MALVATYTIGQLAKAAGVPTSTVRFYERTGLLHPDGRSGGNYRQYTQQALERLRFIRSAQATGFSLDDVRDLLKLTDSDKLPCDDIAALTRKRLEEVRTRLKELRRVERVLTESLENCCRGTSPDLCDRIIGLKGRVSHKCNSGEKCATSS